VPGYEAFLIDEGYEPFEARLMGHAVNSDQLRKTVPSLPIRV
jgi:hypothetical protein